MKILLVTPSFPPRLSGISMVCKSLFAEFSARGDRVRVAGGTPPGPGQIPVPMTRIAFPFAVLRLLPAVFWAEVVHIHGRSMPGFAAFFLGKILRRRTILTLHGGEIWAHDARRRPFCQKMLRGADAVVAVSDALAAETFARAGRRPLVVEPPVAEIFFENLDLEPPREPLILNTKGPGDLGRQSLLLEAFARVRQKIPAARLALMARPGRAIADLKNLAAKLGVAEAVEWREFSSPETIRGWLREAKTYALTSFLESYANVIPESLAQNLPVVAVKNPGAIELAARFPEAPIFLVARDDPAALAAAIIEVFQKNPTVPPAVRAEIREKLNPRAIAEKYRKIYKNG